MIDVDLGLNRLATFTLTKLENNLVVICRCGYRSHTSHYYSHNTGDHGRLLCIPGAYSPVDDIIHENERGDSRGDGARRGSRSQEISKYSFNNYKESVDGGGRSGYRSQTSPYSPHNLVGIVIPLGFYSYGHERSEN